MFLTKVRLKFSKFINMFSLAIIIGIYSYLIFSLGVLGLLYKSNVIVLTIFFLTVIYFFNKNKRPKLILDFNGVKLILWIILILAAVNLIGALGPELGFDALWYHLTLPKLFLLQHRIMHIPGGLLYYSDMPKLTEMLYVSALSFGNEILAKLVHFSFGVLTAIAVYRLSRKFLQKKLSLIAVLVFYGNLVVSWQSTTAYIDLVRTFFEIMALWGFINFEEKREKRWLVESAVILGLAVSTKLIALGSLFIFAVLIILVERKVTKNILLYVFTSLLIASPWFIFSFLQTGNPIYPLFTKFYNVKFNYFLLNPLNFIKEIMAIFTMSTDPISPIYLIFLPVILILFKKFNNTAKILIYYTFLSLLVWYFTPRTGGGRFLMPYLPAFSILIAISINKLSKNIKNFSVYFIILISLISILYRGVANYKYIPVELGLESRDRFLAGNLNFSFGDFYDTDGYFKNHINSNDKVLLYGFHNLYYVDFPFTDSSYVKKGDDFNYIAVQNSKIPQQFNFWKLIYSNNLTKVNLYSIGGQKWAY